MGMAGAFYVCGCGEGVVNHRPELIIHNLQFTIQNYRDERIIMALYGDVEKGLDGGIFLVSSYGCFVILFTRQL
jgi:hypothetical protein